MQLTARTMAAALALSVLLGGPAMAASAVCRQIEAQLAAAQSGGGGGSAQFRKYDSAVQKQRGELAKARRQARNAGCGFSLLGGKRCTPINATIDRMERNLDTLERRRSELAGRGGSSRERTRLLARLNANGCRDEERVAADPRPAQRDLFARLFGAEPPPPRDREAEEEPAAGMRRTLDDGHIDTHVRRVIVPDPSPQGEFRTACVRTCDGYYFPMSPASSRIDFDRDQKNCESMCPGTEVRLFYQPAGSEGAETLVSWGEDAPYADMPTAYAYRNAEIARPEGCGCTPGARNFAVIAGDAPEEAAAAEPTLPMPVAKPDPAADPETLANAEGGFSPEVVRRLLKPKEKRQPETGERRIRVVGPVFLPDQEGAIDLRAPGRKEVQ